MASHCWQKANITFKEADWRLGAHLPSGTYGGKMFGLCGRYVNTDRIEAMRNVDDDDDPEALFCHKCLDKWRTRNPFG